MVKCQNEQISIWYVVSEAEGLVKSGGLADVAKALPKALQELAQNISIVIPAYRQIRDIDKAPIVLSTGLDYWPYTHYQVRELDLDGVTVFAIDCPRYFDRSELYGENNTEYHDNGERFGFFSAACLDCLPKLEMKPDIVHVNDWHVGLVPLLLKVRYRNDSRYQDMRSVITVHNAMFQGIYSYNELSVVPELKHIDTQHLKYSDTHLGMLKAGLAYADKINAVSPNYAKELLTTLGSHGLHNEFNRRSDDLSGILNGCDYSDWNPENDRYIPVKYKANVASLQAGKSAAKQAIQQEYHLERRKVPLFGMVCRLSHQKGFEYLLPILEKVLAYDVQIFIIGTGDSEIARQLSDISNRNREKFVFIETYSNRLAHMIEAGADFFLMPSQFEACGLNQIYSMAYGTLPIVRSVGGLKDTVTDYDENSEEANGFAFLEPSSEQLLIAIQRALILYLQSPRKFREIQVRGMRQDFSWRHSARSYIDLYRSVL
jgi:starch synthase